MLNQVVLIGRMTRDPEERQAGEHSVTEFSLAVDRGRTDKTDFINCQAWNKLGENVGKYCGKGSLVAVTGELNIDTWEKDGQKRNAAKVNCNNVRFLDSRKKNNDEDAPF